MFRGAWWDKLQQYYKWYVLGLVSVGYILGELGHYLIAILFAPLLGTGLIHEKILVIYFHGTTSKLTAEDLHYGDISCQLNASSHYTLAQLPVVCEKVNSSHICESLELNGTRYCEWGYSGLGLDYQVLAGPAFMAVFTVVGVILGVVADKYNRARTLAICTLVFAVAIVLMGSVTEYWHLVILRMVMAAGEAGCNPLATGILSDIFPEHQRALVLSIFNWGIYGGYGIAFPVGRYLPEVSDLSWRVCYYGAGVIALIITALTFATLREPERTEIGEEGTAHTNSNSATVEGAKQPQITIWKVIAQPRIILLCLAASIRHCGGMTFAYNADLYYRDYFPDVDLGWWLFAVTVGIGSVGVVVGGVVSDRFVAKMGVRSRVAVLALSQLISTLPAFGSVIFGPLWAMITLAISYFFAEMWFGIVFAILVEIVPLNVRSTTVGVFLFVMNNVGGNLPILVDPVSKAIGYREAIMIFYAGFYGISSILFFLTMFLMDGPVQQESNPEPPHKRSGLDNRAFTHDDNSIPMHARSVAHTAVEQSRL